MLALTWQPHQALPLRQQCICVCQRDVMLRLPCDIGPPAHQESTSGQNFLWHAEVLFVRLIPEQIMS